MRATAPTTPSTPLIADVHGGSAVSLHSRSGSRGRSLVADPTSAVVTRLMYEAAERQLDAVRRSRNPIVEAVRRLKEGGWLISEKGVPTSGDAGGKGKERRKKANSQKRMDNDRNTKSDPDLKAQRGTGSGGGADGGPRSSFEDSNAPGHSAVPDQMSRTLSHGTSTWSGHISGGAGKVRFRRQGSHDDIGLSRSQGSYDDGDDDGNMPGGRSDRDDQGHNHDHGGSDGARDGNGGLGGEGAVSAEEELRRRMWESREVYDKGE